MLVRPLYVSISDQANLFARQCALYVEPLGGTVQIMANVRHMWEVIYRSTVTDAPKALVTFVREKSRGSEQLRNELNRVDRNWLIVLMRGHGLTKNKMAKTQEDRADDFYTHCEKLRDQLRIILNVSAENPLDYVGMGPLPGVARPETANIFLDAYQIELNTASDLLAVVEENPSQPADA